MQYLLPKCSEFRYKAAENKDTQVKYKYLKMCLKHSTCVKRVALHHCFLVQTNSSSVSLPSLSCFFAAMKSDRKRLKAEKADLVNQMQQLYATLESREEQLRDFIRNYEQHRKVRHKAPDSRALMNVQETSINIFGCIHVRAATQSI